MDWCAAKRPRKPITYLESSASRSMGVSDIFVFVADAIYDYALAADSLSDEEDDDDVEDSSTEVSSDMEEGDGSYETPAKVMYLFYCSNTESHLSTKSIPTTQYLPFFVAHVSYILLFFFFFLLSGWSTTCFPTTCCQSSY